MLYVQLNLIADFPCMWKKIVQLGGHLTSHSSHQTTLQAQVCVVLHWAHYMQSHRPVACNISRILSIFNTYMTVGLRCLGESHVHCVLFFGCEVPKKECCVQCTCMSSCSLYWNRHWSPKRAYPWADVQNSQLLPRSITAMWVGSKQWKIFGWHFHSFLSLADPGKNQQEEDGSSPTPERSTEEVTLKIHSNNRIQQYCSCTLQSLRMIHRERMKTTLLVSKKTVAQHCLRRAVKR